jgi:hypothetical protein
MKAFILTLISRLKTAAHSEPCPYWTDYLSGRDPR